MKRRRMFADISLFSDAGFMRNHPDGYLTLSDGVHHVTFFAYLNVYSTAPAYHAVFVTDTERREYLEYIFTEAKHTQTLTEADLDENAHLLLLSTCTYEFTDARGILIGLIE
jgi:sortase B